MELLNARVSVEIPSWWRSVLSTVRQECPRAVGQMEMYAASSLSFSYLAATYFIQMLDTLAKHRNVFIPDFQYPYLWDFKTGCYVSCLAFILPL